MTNRPRGPQSPTPRPQTRRQVAYQQRESKLQRNVALAIGGAVALALLLVVGGFIWEQFVVPRNPVASVNNETLTRREYDQLQRSQIISQQIVQGLQFLRLFGNQNFGQQSFDQQVLQGNFQLASIGTPRSRREPVEEAQVQAWIDRQVLEQGAAGQFNINPDQGQVDQALVASLGSFLPTEAVSGTDTLTGTDTLSGTTGVTGTSDVTGTAATATPPPTATPFPEQATQQAEQIIDAVYSDYTNLINQFAANAVGLPADQRTPNVTRDELATTLRNQFREQVVRQQVSERLVPELPADTGEGPEFIQLRQIVLQVPPPAAADGTDNITDTGTLTDTGALTDTETLTDTAAATDTTQLSPEELDALFAQRLEEANGIVQQLRDDPDSFAALAQERSNDATTAAQGGEVGLIDRQGALQQGEASLPQAVVDAAWALPDNGISDPIRTENGWVIVQRQPEDPQDRLQRLRQNALTDWLSQQRATAQVSPAPSASPSPSEGPTPFTTEPAGEESPSSSEAAP